MGYQIPLAELMLSGDTSWPEYMKAHFSLNEPSEPVETIIAELTKQMNLITSSGYSYQDQVKALTRIIRAHLHDKSFDM